MAAGRLRYRDFLTVALVVEKPDLFPDNWIYIHEPSVKVPRRFWIAAEFVRNEVDAPELAPGRYVVTVRALDALAGQTIKRSFAVADADARARFERARDELRARSPSDLADLIEAHYALHAGYSDAAHGAATRAAAQEGEIAEQAERILERLRRAP